MKKQTLSYRQGLWFQGEDPTLLMAGEIHYFRCPKSLWEVHLKRLKEVGCTVVSTYVPWLIHEPIEGQFEFQGESLEQYDLGSFLALCQQHGLTVFLRPGPFVMAELHAEGIASYLLDRPDLKPLTWGKSHVPNGQVDYLHPYYLSRVEAYYQALFTFIQPFLVRHGGPVELVQLDNEIGMMAWVSQSPPLTEDIVAALGETFDATTYHFHPHHHADGHQRLGTLLRARYAAYVETLHTLLQRYAGDLITLVNIHGTSQGRGLTFPIGFSQLLDTFDKHVIGTDIYYEQLTLRNAHDYYMINSHLNALKHPNTPATCLEFNAGNSNFGDNLGGYDTRDSMDKKIRLLFIQGHKLINFYLFSGGMNPPTHPSYHTANGRIAITGERHGFAAPVKLSGETTPMFDQMKETLKRLAVYGHEVAYQTEVTSNLTIGLMLDHYMTDSMRHGTDIEALKVDLTRHREGAFVETFLKQALLLHVPMKTVHLERHILDVTQHPILAISTASSMAKTLQQSLVAYLQAGGKIFFMGALPTQTLTEEPCTLLLDYLGIQAGLFMTDATYPQLMIHADQPIEGYPTFRAPYAQQMKHSAYSATHDREGNALSYVSDTVVWLTHPYPGYLYLTQRWFDHLGVQKPVNVHTEHSVYVFKTHAAQGTLLHVLNFESFDVTVTFEGCPFTKLTIKAYGNLMLPLNYRLYGYTISATCELIEASQTHLTFATHGLPQTVWIHTDQTFDHPDCVRTNEGYRCDFKATSSTQTLK